MKKTALFALALILSAALFGCMGKETQALSAGRYVMEGAEEPFAPYVQLEEDSRFLFVHSFLSSYLPAGTYSVEDDVLTLRTEDGQFTYVFQIAGDSLLFDQANTPVMQVMGGESAIFGRGGLYAGTI